MKGAYEDVFVYRGYGELMSKRMSQELISIVE